MMTPEGYQASQRGYGSSMVKRIDERGDVVADRRAVRLRLGLRPATRHATRTVPQLSRAN